jgi:ParB family chromosome partitioning protein
MPFAKDEDMTHQATIFDDASITTIPVVAGMEASESEHPSVPQPVARRDHLRRATARSEDLVQDGLNAIIPLAAIAFNPWQPRCRKDPQALNRLARSIEEVGLLQPIIVRRTPVANGESSYQLVAGERRVRAVALLGHEEISAVVIDVADHDMAVMGLVENLEREDLSDFEIGKAIRRIETEFESRRALAETLGMAPKEFYRYLAFEKLPAEVLADLEKDGRLMSRKTADDLAGLLNRHGQAARDTLLDIWPKVRNGEIEHPKLAALVEATLRKGEPVHADRIVQKLFSQDNNHTATITRDAKGFSLRIKSSVISDEQSESLGQYVLGLLNATIK